MLFYACIVNFCFTVTASATVLRYIKPSQWRETEIQLKRKQTWPNLSVSVSNFSVPVNGIKIFPLTDISVSIWVNVNHTGHSLAMHKPTIMKPETPQQHTTQQNTYSTTHRQQKTTHYRKTVWKKHFMALHAAICKVFLGSSVVNKGTEVSLQRLLEMQMEMPLQMPSQQVGMFRIKNPINLICINSFRIKSRYARTHLRKIRFAESFLWAKSMMYLCNQSVGTGGEAVWWNSVCHGNIIAFKPISWSWRKRSFSLDWINLVQQISLRARSICWFWTYPLSQHWSLYWGHDTTEEKTQLQNDRSYRTVHKYNNRGSKFFTLVKKDRTNWI